MILEREGNLNFKKSMRQLFRVEQETKSIKPAFTDDCHAGDGPKEWLNHSS